MQRDLAEVRGRILQALGESDERALVAFADEVAGWAPAHAGFARARAVELSDALSVFLDRTLTTRSDELGTPGA